MDRRQVLGAAAAALGGTLVGLPVEAAASLETWVILQDPYDADGENGPDELATGAFLKATKTRKAKVQRKKNKLWGAEGAIDVSESDRNRGTFSGTILVPVVKYKSLPFEMKQALISLNEIVDVIAALLAPNRDALDQIDVSREELNDLERVVRNSKTLSEEDKSFIDDMIQKSRIELSEAQSMIEQLPNNPSGEQLIAVAQQIILAATPMRGVWISFRPKA
jgi:hypothetical protein